MQGTVRVKKSEALSTALRRWVVNSGLNAQTDKALSKIVLTGPAIGGLLRVQSGAGIPSIEDQVTAEAGRYATGENTVRPATRGR